MRSVSLQGRSETLSACRAVKSDGNKKALPSTRAKTCVCCMTTQGSRQRNTRKRGASWTVISLSLSILPETATPTQRSTMVSGSGSTNDRLHDKTETKKMAIALTPPSGAAYEARRALKRIESHNSTGISMALSVTRDSALGRCKRSVRLSRSKTCWGSANNLESYSRSERKQDSSKDLGPSQLHSSNASSKGLKGQRPKGSRPIARLHNSGSLYLDRLH